MIPVLADDADLHVYEIPIRDHHQKWVPNQEEELSSGSHCKRHGILLCGKVSCHLQILLCYWTHWTGDFQCTLKDVCCHVIATCVLPCYCEPGMHCWQNVAPRFG